MCAGFNAAEVGQRRDHADRSVPHIPRYATLLKKSTPVTQVSSSGAHRSAPTSASRAAWLIDDRGTEIVVFAAKPFEPFGERAVTEIRRAADHDARGLTRRV
jgi:hypothetical protein